MLEKADKMRMGKQMKAILVVLKEKGEYGATPSQLIDEIEGIPQYARARER